ncbi:MAG TPA: hypothetical protein PKX99_02015 [Thermoanaerobaculia bacterium]|nr:hypothetical protein [Thermoanaerobaculia bacterium]
MRRLRAGRRRTPRRPVRFGLLALLLFALAVPLAAQVPVAATGIEIGPAVGQNLVRLQELWAQWVTAFYQGRPDMAEAATREMERIAGQLGMRQLPNLAQAMAAKAVDSARSGDPERALWALEMADRLWPGQPEIALAHSRVAAASGAPLAALRWEATGWRRLAGEPPARRLLWRAFVAWTSALLLAAAGLYLLLQFAIKGPNVYRNLQALCARRLPGGASHAVAFAALVWPLALPGGLVWWLLWISALLWVHSSLSERWVQAALWLLAGVMPVLVAQQIPHSALELSPPARAMAALQAGRLEGSLFTDLGVLRSSLPQSVGVQLLVGDLHRHLGQWEYARSVYRQLLEAHPGTVDALLSLGAFHARQEEYATATQYYERAATVDPNSAAAYYNMSLAYSEVYQFDESRQALDKARRLDSQQVAEWVRTGDRRRAVVFDGGLARIREIRSELAAVRGYATSLRLADCLPLAATLACALLALLWERLLRRFGGGRPVSLATVRPAWLEWLIGLVLPAWRAAEEGAGGRAFAGVIGPLALLMLPFASRLAVFPPAAVTVRWQGLGWASVFAIALLVAVRAWRERRRTR